MGRSQVEMIPLDISKILFPVPKTLHSASTEVLVTVSRMFPPENNHHPVLAVRSVSPSLSSPMPLKGTMSSTIGRSFCDTGIVPYQGASGHREKRSKGPPEPSKGRNLVLGSEPVSIRKGVNR